MLAAGNSSSSGSAVGNLLFLALLAGAMYLFIIRPQRTRMRDVTKAQKALEPGREVILSSGIYGTVLHVEQDRIGLEIAPGVQVTVARAAVARVVDPVVAAEEASDPAP
ncbi:MAG: preprotein translocase subunit YajC [Mycobacteriales bacterium]